MQQKALQLQHLMQGFMFAGRSMNIPPRSQPNDNVMQVDFGENSLTTTTPGWNNASGNIGVRPTHSNRPLRSGRRLHRDRDETSWTVVDPDNAGGVSSSAVIFGATIRANRIRLHSAVFPSRHRGFLYVRNGNKMTISLENTGRPCHVRFSVLRRFGRSRAPSTHCSPSTGTTSQQAHIAPIVNNSTQVATVNGIAPNA